jgi:hypothetical protein
MAYLIIGSRKLGTEAIIAIGSYFWTFFMGHLVTLREGPDYFLENLVYYVVGVYGMMMYLAIVLSDPGWID